MRMIKIACAATLAVALSGCGAVVYSEAPELEARAAWLPAPADRASLLLGAGEGEDFGDVEGSTPGEEVGGAEEEDTAAAGEVDTTRVPTEVPAEVPPAVPPPVPAERGGRGSIALKVGLGLALPGSGSIGSAPGSDLPAYSDAWTTGSVVQIVGEFMPSKAVKPYAQLAFSQFAGQRFTGTNSADSWILSDSPMTLLAGGARFGRTYYGKASLGLLFWPEVSRIDSFSGYSEPILESGALLALTIGGGAEFAIGKLKAYADAELTFLPAPERSENAVVFWPHFEPEATMTLGLTGGVAFGF